MTKLSAIKRHYIDLKLVLLLAAFYAVFDLVLIGKMLYQQSFHYESNFEWPHFLVFNLLFDYVIVVCYMVFIAITTKRFLNKKFSWFKIIFIHLLLSLIIGIVIRLVLDLYNIIIGKLSFDQFDIEESIFKFMFVIDLNFLIYFAMIFIIYTYYYVKEVKAAEKKQRDLESQLLKTKMRMLSSQLQPHFLFNTLNSIAVLTDIDASKAKDTIADLSDFLRETLYDNDSIYITLEKELRVLDYYLNILHVRFSDHLIVKKEIDKKLLKNKIPALLIQPILENSIKHGYSYNHTDLEVIIKVFRKEEYLYITVENNGESLGEPQGNLMLKGMGLKNVEDRLNGLYGKDYQFTLKNKEYGHGVISTIKIPLL